MARSSASIRRWCIAGWTSARRSRRADERARVPHHLIDLREPWQPYSAAEFASDARAAIDGIVVARQVADPGRRHRPVFPRVAAGARADARSRRRDARADHRRSRKCAAGRRCMPSSLRSIPQAAARIHATDAQRIQRALEVWRVSGRADQRLAASMPRHRGCRCACSSWCCRPRDRGVLHARIEQRFDAMLAGGLPRRSPSPARPARTARRIRRRSTCRRCARSAIGRPGSTWTATPTPRRSATARSSPPGSWPSAS